MMDKVYVIRFLVNSITGGTDAQGEVTIKLEDEERTSIRAWFRS